MQISLIYDVVKSNLALFKTLSYIIYSIIFIVMQRIYVIGVYYKFKYLFRR